MGSCLRSKNIWNDIILLELIYIWYIKELEDLITIWYLNITSRTYTSFRH